MVCTHTSGAEVHAHNLPSASRVKPLFFLSLLCLLPLPSACSLPLPLPLPSTASSSLFVFSHHTRLPFSIRACMQRVLVEPASAPLLPHQLTLLILPSQFNYPPYLLTHLSSGLTSTFLLPSLNESNITFLTHPLPLLGQ